MRIVANTAFILALILPSPDVLCDDVAHILYLNSYDQRMDWARKILDAIYETLEPDSNNIIIHVENLDSKRHPLTDEYSKLVLDILRTKYASVEFSCVLASDNNAYKFIGDNYDALLGSEAQVPVFHCGVNGLHRGADTPPNNNFYGIAESSFPRETMEDMYELIPELKTVYVINDDTVTGDAWHEHFERTVAGLEEDLDINIVHLRETEYVTSMEDLKGFLRSIDNSEKDKAVLLGVFYKDRSGNYFSFEAQTRTITEAAFSAKVPVFGLLDFQLEQGIVGGRLIGGYEYGKRMAELARDYLKKTALPEERVEYPELKMHNRYAPPAYDYDVARKFGIDIRKLKSIVGTAQPDGNIKGLPIRVVDTATTLISITSIFAVLLIAYIFERARKTIAELNNLYKSPIIGLFQTSVRGDKFLRISPRAAGILGFASVKDALDHGRPSEMYVDPRSRESLIERLHTKRGIGDYRTTIIDRLGGYKNIRISAVLYPRRRYIEGFVEELSVGSGRPVKPETGALLTISNSITEKQSTEFRKSIQTDTLIPQLSVAVLFVGILIILILAVIGMAEIVESKVVAYLALIATPFILMLLSGLVYLTLNENLRAWTIRRIELFLKKRKYR